MNMDCFLRTNKVKHNFCTRKRDSLKKVCEEVDELNIYRFWITS